MLAPAPQDTTIQCAFDQATVVDGGTAAPPIHMVKELESAKSELDTVRGELQEAWSQATGHQAAAAEAAAARDQFAAELDAEKQRSASVQAELQEAEAVMQELIEDKKKSQVMITYNRNLFSLQIIVSFRAGWC